MSSLFRSRITAVAAGAAILVGLGSVSAVAADMIGSQGVQNNSLRSADIRDGAIRDHDLSSWLQKQVRQAGTQGDTGARGPRGPKGESGDDGVSNLTTGAHYRTTWSANSYGETITTCPAGSNAIGGGYSTWGGYPTNPGYDLGGENRDIEVTVNAPYFAGEYDPVNEGGAFRADQWVVRGFNSGDTDQIVRAWVICAEVADKVEEE